MVGLWWGSFWGYLLRELDRQCCYLWRVSIGEDEEMLGRKRVCYKTLHVQRVIRYLEGVQIKRAKSAWAGLFYSRFHCFPVTRHFRLVLVAVHFPK